MENQMTSVKRIKEYVDVVKKKDLRSVTPPPSWTSKGKITFETLSIRYDTRELSILQQLTFKVKKNYIVGRTGDGAGKSSIIITLFRLAKNYRHR